MLSNNLENLIVTRQRDLVDGFKARRALPSARRRMVGPFIFLDRVEFRLEFKGADRAGETRLERGAICAGSGRDGIYPAAGIWTNGCALSLNDNLTPGRGGQCPEPEIHEP